MTPLLEVRDLVKHYGSIKAVKGISFSIRPGICFGLLGPNGAGKTTTLEIIEGIIPRTSGEIYYKGKPATGRIKQEIGIQFQSTSLLQFLSVRETIETFASLYDRSLPVEELADICQLGDFLDQGNDRISGGQRQRLLLALALLNDPDLVFLDEPTTGLDPQARRHVWSIIERIRSQGKTLVLTTHYMEEAERLCDEIVIIDKGTIIAEGAPDALVREHCPGTVISLPESRAEDARQIMGESCRLRDDGGGLRIDTDDPDRCLRAMLEQGIDVSGVGLRPQNLEDVFLQLTGRSLRE